MKKLIALLSLLSMPTTALAEVAYVHGSRTFVASQVPNWQDKLYDDIGISQSTRLLMRTVNQLECGDENGFCLGMRKADAGPFQINNIHGRDYVYSVSMVEAGKKAVAKAKLDGDWKEVLRIRDELFLFQAKWTYERMLRLSKQYGKKVNYSLLSREKQIWYQAVWHNGNRKLQGGREFRFWYGDKAVKHWRALKKVNGTKYVSNYVPLEIRKPKAAPGIEFPELETYEHSLSPPKTGGDFISLELF